MNIVFVGHFRFPTGTASASRIRHLARGLVELGHQVWVITMAPGHVDPCDDRTDGWADWNGVRFRNANNEFGLRPPPARIWRIAGMTSEMRADANRAAAQIDALRRSRGVDVVIGYSNYAAGMNRLVRYCRESRLPHVRDVVEWLGPESFIGGRLNPLFWDSQRGFYRVLPQADGIIAISSTLQRWFQSKGLPTVRIPAVIDPADAPQSAPAAHASADRPFSLMYLGKMVQRDGPMLMMHAVRAAVSAGHDVVFNVVGGTERIPEARRAQAYASADPLLRSRVKFWGRVSDEDVRRHLMESDALVFTRLSGRPGDAAFPTRLPEYLLTGKPVITSAVSDIGEYLADGVDALVIAPDDSTALAEAIGKLVTRPDRGRSIGAAGQAKCAQCFHYATRAREIAEFLQTRILTADRRAAALVAP